MAAHQEFFNNAVEADFFHIMCGEHIGTGASRDVYALVSDPNYVVKIETNAQSFSNIREWDLWQDALIMGEDRSNWLAPCERISSTGIVLIQKRTKPAKKYPEKIPVWMTDTKRSNFGMIGNKFVCHDYGNNLMCNSGLSKRLKKADWWDE